MGLQETRKTMITDNGRKCPSEFLRVIYRNLSGNKWTWSVAINNWIQGNFETEAAAVAVFDILLKFNRKAA